MKIAFLIDHAALSGGNYVVYQHALHACEAGHDVTIVTLARVSPYANVWHPAIPKLTFRHVDEVADQNYDITFATYWRTALELYRIQSHRYAYFVQSIETRFYPVTAVEKRAFIESIYAWRLPGITEATWIREYLETHHGSQYHLVRNGIRKDLYRVDGPQLAPRNDGQIRVLIEGAFGSIKNTARALSTARRAGNIDVWLLTTPDIPWYPGVERLFHRMPIEQVPPIYRSCDVILKLSLVEGMFGPPLEMFHCGGTAIVYDVSGHDEYIANGRNALVAPMHDELKVIDYLRQLNNEPELLASLKMGALETALTWPSWDASSTHFLSAVEALCSEEIFTRDRLMLERSRLKDSFPAELAFNDLANKKIEAKSVSGVISSARKRVRDYSLYLGRIADSYR